MARRPMVEMGETAAERRQRGCRHSRVAKDPRWAVKMAGASGPNGLVSGGGEEWRRRQLGSLETYRRWRG